MKNSFTLITFLLILFTGLILQQQTLAQNTARIAGVVTDASSGEPLPGVNVFLEGPDYGDATDRSGRYRIEGIPLGSYTLKARYIGYSEYTTEI